MQQEDDLVSIAKTIHLIRASAVIIMVVHFYWFCHEGFNDWNITHPVIDHVLLGLQRKTSMFARPLYSKCIAFCLLLISIVGTKSVSKEGVRKRHIAYCAAVGLPLFWFSDPLLKVIPVNLATILYILSTLAGFLLCMTAGILCGRLLNFPSDKDPFNLENESFRQEEKLIENEYSINLPTRYYYNKEYRNGWINVVNPFRASIVLGTPGSGKSFAVINNYIKQHIEKGFSMYLYDFKFDDLSIIAYNHLLRNIHKYKVPPKFYVINFDNPRLSNRCNAINPAFMTDIADAFEASYNTMLNLNRTWIEKQGDFFVDSPIILLAAIIWFLKIYEKGKYCTFPHAIELINKPYSKVFNILSAYPELENYMSAFRDAMLNGAQEQLQGQIASAKIPLSRMISPQLYWVMSGDDFSLDINNPDEPKILCMGNNPDRMNIYSAALGLYSSRIVRLINQKGKLKCSVIIDELPTVYIRNLDSLIATCRSNKISVCLGIQDFSQLSRDYGHDEADVIQNTVGNIFSGQVVGDTAKNLSEKFGKIVQRRESISIADASTTTSVNTQLDSLIPASKISSLSQGTFVGAVADNFGEEIEQKFFHGQIIVDSKRVKQEEKTYRSIPTITAFKDESGNDIMDRVIMENYYRIKKEVDHIISSEEQRIKSDPKLKYLFPEKNR